MFSFCDQRHKIYTQEYNKYLAQSQKREGHLTLAARCRHESDICNLWLFKSPIKGGECFLVIPSLFNSPEILLIQEEQNYIEHLRSFGDVYLLEWQETDRSLNLSDYAFEVATAAFHIRGRSSSSVNLVGHCIGGNLAIFSLFINNNIGSLTLLTTPWDYSHFLPSLLLSEFMEIRKAINNLKTVPKIYIQMMFFLLFPDNYEAKIARYFALSGSGARNKHLLIEKWLQSGIDMPSSLYHEILDELIAKNLLANNNFYINNQLVSLDRINVPTCVVSARQDQMAPPPSIVPLHKGIKNSTIITVEGGHIGYLVNNDQAFRENYTNWFMTKNRPGG